jgi:hypothetical protein
MKKLILGLAAGAAVAAAAVAGAGMASADVSTNGTVNDANGYGVANHIANFNGDHDGIGWIRSAQTGDQISAQSGTKKVADLNGVRSSQGKFDPISNNGGK